MNKKIPMKKNLLLFLSLFFFITSNAQIKKRYNRGFFGLNIGGTWQQSDVRDQALVGGGFTFGKYYHQNESNLFDFGWRFRYLNGNTKGQDFVKNTGIKNNPVFNGTAGQNLNYADSTGYVYNNYKMHFDEGAFEIMIGLNKLREKTRVVFYGFGGIGISGYQTKTNQLNGTKMYAYDSLTSPSLTTFETFLDKSYETNAEGNSKVKAHFVPSVGAGLAWQTRRGHYIGFEHRLTFTLNDLADGVQYNNSNLPTGNNDWYHYGGLFVRWMIGGGSTSGSSRGHNSNPDSYSHNPPPTYTGTPTYTSTVVNPPPPPPPPGNVKPMIVIHYPNANPFTTNNNIATVTASVLNVNSRNEIAVQVNGFPSQNFTYDVMTKALSITSTLNAGNNSFYISAMNKAGSDWKSVSIIYEQGISPPPSEQKPVVTVSFPATTPYSHNQNTITVTGTVVNVASKNQISVNVNGAVSSAFLYDANSKIISIPTNLILGSNIVTITATNSSGSDSKSAVINYQNATPPPAGQKPVITILYPSSNPFTTQTQPITINGDIINVKAKEDITVSVNGRIVEFSYSTATKAFDLTTSLGNGNNTIKINAKNNYGTDSKTLTIIFEMGGIHPVDPIAAKPIVTITSPNTNPYSAGNTSQTVNATVQNVKSKNEIAVTVNGVSTTNFSYDGSSKILSVTSPLNEGTNVFIITASNSSGSDSKSLTVNYKPKVSGVKPTVTITSPSSNPHTVSIHAGTVNASVQNVSSQQDIQVAVNNQKVTSFSFDPGSKILSVTSNLNPGPNTFVITATNPYGSDSKTQSIIYAEKNVVPPPVITVFQPSANPLITGTNILDASGSVTNVSSKNDIVVKVNNVPLKSFSYDLNSKALVFKSNLNPGSNQVEITATNAAGKDTKTLKVIYNKPPDLPKPVVTITYPATNPFTTEVANITITATVVNIGSKSDITVTGLGGIQISNFNYDPNTKILSLPQTLTGGSHPFTITATNAQGSDSKSVTVKYIKTETTGEVIGNPKGTRGGSKPVVTFTYPTGNPANVPSPTVNFTATVLNVASKSDISVKLNGADVPSFNYDPATKIVSFTSKMPMGSGNIVTISATNAQGTDTKSITVGVL